jgi:sugar phosphate isomerase/epimerase
MRFSLSTNWNSRRHEAGEELVDEILALGFDALELGYHMTEELAKGIRRRIDEGAIAADSVHAYCPVPFNAPHGYPELHLLASLDEDERAMASILIGRTLTFAASMGARAVVLHAGRIFLNSFFGDLGTQTLLNVFNAEDASARERYLRHLEKARRRRAARAEKYFDGFCRSLDTLLPKFEAAGVALCLENLPSIEAFPDETEMAVLKRRFATPALAYWHDLGHGQVRENLLWCDHAGVARALLPFTRGVHIHDVRPPVNDHLAPGSGMIDFQAFASYGADGIIKVFEPASDVSGAELSASLRLVETAWREKNPDAAQSAADAVLPTAEAKNASSC